MLLDSAAFVRNLGRAASNQHVRFLAETSDSRCVPSLQRLCNICAFLGDVRESSRLLTICAALLFRGKSVTVTSVFRVVLVDSNNPGETRIYLPKGSFKSRANCDQRRCSAPHTPGL